jgi:hypothetical protein
MVLLAAYFPGATGNIANYLAVSFFFAAIYYFFQDNSSWSDGNVKTFIDCLYFSLVTQATVGYGDITPKSEGMRFLVAMQIIVTYSLPLLTVMTN